VSDYRERADRAAADRENLRAQRFRELDEALTAVRTHEVNVLSAAEQDTLTAAAAVVASLRQVW
jgi:hypothetical protein